MCGVVVVLKYIKGLNNVNRYSRLSSVLVLFYLSLVMFITSCSNPYDKKALHSDIKDNTFMFDQMHFFSIMDMLDYVSNDFSIINKDKYVIPYLSSSSKILYAQHIGLYTSKDRFKYLFSLDGGHENFLSITLEKVSIPNEMEWYDEGVIEVYGETVLKEYNGVKYREYEDSNIYEFYHDGVSISCFFKYDKEPLLSKKEELELSLSVTYMEPIFMGDGKVVLRQPEMENINAVIDGQERDLEYEHSEVLIATRQYIHVYKNNDIYFLFKDKDLDNCIGYRVEEDTVKTKPTVSRDIKKEANDFLQKHTDIMKYNVIEEKVEDTTVFQYIQYVNGYKTTNYSEVEFDEHGNIISYLIANYELPDRWHEIEINDTLIQEHAQAMTERSAYNTLDNFSLEDYWLALSENGDEIVVCKVKFTIENIESNDEYTMFIKFNLDDVIK